MRVTVTTDYTYHVSEAVPSTFYLVMYLCVRVCVPRPQRARPLLKLTWSGRSRARIHHQGRPALETLRRGLELLGPQEAIYWSEGCIDNDF